MGLFNKRKKQKSNTSFIDLLSDALQDANNNAQTTGSIIFNNQRPADYDFGHSENNPIFTNSLSSTEEYLSRLCTKDGKKFTWSPYTSIKASINGIHNIGEDKYTIYLDNKEYTNLFFVLYIGESEFPPAGLYFSDDDRDWDLEREALERDIPVDTWRKMKEIEREFLEAKQKEAEEKALLEKEKSILIKSKCKTIKEKYPSFDLEDELNNKVFSFLSNIGFDLLTAYEYVHKDDVFSKKTYSEQPLDKIYSEEYYFNLICDMERDKCPTSENVSSKSKQDLQKEADELELTVEQLIKMKSIENRFSVLRWETHLKEFREYAKQAEKTKKLFPTFDLSTEWHKDHFQTIAKELDITTAYEIINFYELYAPKVISENNIVVKQKDKLFCRKCGTPLALDSVFCHKCGVEVFNA